MRAILLRPVILTASGLFGSDIRFSPVGIRFSTDVAVEYNSFLDGYSDGKSGFSYFALYRKEDFAQFRDGIRSTAVKEFENDRFGVYTIRNSQNANFGQIYLIVWGRDRIDSVIYSTSEYREETVASIVSSFKNHTEFVPDLKKYLLSFHREFGADRSHLKALSNTDVKFDFNLKNIGSGTITFTKFPSVPGLAETAAFEKKFHQSLYSDGAVSKIYEKVDGSTLRQVFDVGKSKMMYSRISRIDSNFYITDIESSDIRGQKTFFDVEEMLIKDRK
jgi:hypothetical protein